MQSVRRFVPALALIAAFLTAASAPALASTLHLACTTEHHHCEAQARIASCCCGHDAAQPDSTPVQSRVEVRADLAAVPAATSDVLVVASPRPLLRVHTSPPFLFLSLRDLPTLFAFLLI